MEELIKKYEMLQAEINGKLYMGMPGGYFEGFEIGKLRMLAMVIEDMKKLQEAENGN